MARPEKIRIGELLIKRGIITEEQMQAALDEQKRSGRKFGRLLVEMGFTTDKAVAVAVAAQLGAEFVDLKQYQVPHAMRQAMPETLARRLRVIPLREQGEGLVVGFSDPGNLLAYDELVRQLKRPIEMAIVIEDAMRDALDHLYQDSARIGSIVEELSTELGSTKVDMGAFGALEGSEGAPVARLIQSIFESAMRLRASDIHIEPQDEAVMVRFRIDGVLQKHLEADPKVANAVVLRLKLLAGLDISEKRLPQDGRFNVKIGEKPVDIRLSTVPTQFGESAVMRVLNHASSIPKLDRLNMPAAVLEGLREAIARPHGIVLVTGPTGSGKTTTLYSALAELNGPDVKIMTVEDPVEYRLPGITQVQVNEKIELTFQKVLLTCLRQDPDILLIGEMRDRETAEIAMRAAMTGHMVLSTLHTNDAATTPIRLLDMGVPGFMVAMSVNMVLAQRLVRVMCEQCREPAELLPGEREWLRLEVGDAADGVHYHKPRGCSRCNGSGYVGRQGVYEMLKMTSPLVQATTHSDPGRFVALAREQMAGATLRSNAAALVMQGRTTVDEAMRVAYQVDE